MTKVRLAAERWDTASRPPWRYNANTSEVDARLTAAGAMLRGIEREPSVLSVCTVPHNEWGPAIERRRRDGERPCFQCGQPAECAYIVQLPESRWLDLCSECGYWATRANAREKP